MVLEDPEDLKVWQLAPPSVQVPSNEGFGHLEARPLMTFGIRTLKYSVVELFGSGISVLCQAAAPDAKG